MLAPSTGKIKFCTRMSCILDSGCLKKRRGIREALRQSLDWQKLAFLFSTIKNVGGCCINAGCIFSSGRPNREEHETVTKTLALT